MFIVVTDRRDLCTRFEDAFPARVAIVRETRREFRWRLTTQDIDGVTAVVFDARSAVAEVEELIDTVVSFRRHTYLFAIVPPEKVQLAGDLAHRGVDRCIGDNAGAAAIRDVLLETLSRFRALTSPLTDVPELQTVLVGRSRVMQVLRNRVRRIADFDDPVLITGETGVGKDVVARGIHQLSRRRENGFQALNVTAVVDSLFESEMFGVRPGAYTGAVASPGILCRNDGGTVFLDEIGDLPVALQPKLLRAVETGFVRPVGGTQDRPVSVRLISATNQNLPFRMKSGVFRRDLWFRLSTIKVTVPPLREHLEDLEEISYHILEDRGYGDVRIGRGAFSWLKRYAWPGNVRELAAVLIRAVLYADGTTILPEHIELDDQDAVVPALPGKNRWVSEARGYRTLAEPEPTDLPGLLPD
jgi:transcriptional regulator with PAS, ATPase and Fis domain